MATFLLGVALPAAFIAGIGLNPTAADSGATNAAGPATVTATATATTTVTATATATRTRKVTRTVTAAPEPVDQPSSAAPRARGTLLVQAGPAGGFGQGFAEGRCAVSKTGFVNQSDTAIDQITVAAPAGEYLGEWNGHVFATRPAADPAPTVLNVYLAPGARAAFEYKSCTSTPSPGSKFEYNSFAPDDVTFRWETGQTGRTCFKC